MRRILETFGDVLDEAWRELRNARLRTYLATLGIVVGAIGLTVLMCMFHLESMLQEKEEDKGLQIGIPDQYDDQPIFTHMRRLKRYHLIPADGEAIQRECAHVERVDITGWIKADLKGTKWYRSLLESANLTRQHHVQLRPGAAQLGTLQWGRTFTPAEMKSGAHVVMIDERMAMKLWPPAYRAGKSNRLGSRYIRINGVRFEIIGLLVGQMGSSRAIIPYTCMQDLFWDARWGLSAVAKRGFKAEAAKQINAVLSRRIGDPGPGFAYVTRKGVSYENLRVYVFFGIIGILVLLAAGMAVSNKAYIDALERVQQFAARRALGATTSRIYAIVLTESALICGFGCLYGGLIGWMFFVSYAAWQLYGAASRETRIWSSIPALPLAGVFLFVIALGVLGSLQGAAVAAKANPAEVLARKDIV